MSQKSTVIISTCSAIAMCLAASSPAVAADNPQKLNDVIVSSYSCQNCEVRGVDTRLLNKIIKVGTHIRLVRGESN